MCRVNSGRVALVMAGGKLSRVDVQVDLIAGPGHAVPVDEVIANGRPQLRREIVAQGEAQFRHDRELIAFMHADVARQGQQSTGIQGRRLSGNGS